MRQSDPAFRRLLNNVRIGRPTEEDIQLLNERKRATGIVNKRNFRLMGRCLREMQERDPSTIALFPLRRDVRALNYTILDSLNLDMVSYT